ncbi:hypothetical protein FBU59_002358 [Linderina macrospora]|uniref:Uncharacterized protein n=1 Tax=Linderina macrospora TaxID=4868 RepID=A0ACC1JBN1_9FUNG|nr:hypothetical protein FBU59_002358 [Linderina macrospora]
MFRNLLSSRVASFAPSVRAFSQSALCQQPGATAARPGAKKAVKKAAKKTTKKPAKKPAKKAPKTPSKAAILEKQLNSKRALVKLPKGPTPTFGLFINEVTADLKKEQSGVVDITEITRVASQKWRALSDAEKQKYQSKHAELKEKHKEVVREWWATVDRGLVELENKRRRRINATVAKEKKGSRITLLKDPYAPKRPLTAFIIYASDKMSKGAAGQGLTEMSAQVKANAALWKSLSDAEKAPFEQRSRADKARYEKELAVYHTKFGIKA